MNLVKKSVVLCIATLVGLMALQGAMSIWQVSKMAVANSEVARNNAMSTSLRQVWTSVQNTNFALARLMSLQDVTSIDAIKDDYTRQSRGILSEIDAISSQADPILVPLIQGVKESTRTWLDMGAGHVSNNGVRRLASFHELTAAHLDLKRQVEALQQAGSEMAIASVRTAEELAEKSFWWSVSQISAGIVFGILFGWLVIRLQHRQLGADACDVCLVANEIANGNLSVPIDSRKVPEASVMAAMGRMQTSLRDTVRQVRDISDGLASHAVSISDDNRSLMARTTEQRESLAQTLGIVNDLGENVRVSNSKSQSANDLALQASEATSQTGSAVSNAVVLMGEIDQSSNKISDIVDVIDSIAFQTNLLALNAAVEAARAGEQGRGFAVVASEVRVLSQRTTNAAKDIAGLVVSSVTQARNGSSMVSDAGQKMCEVVASIGRVGAQMQEIQASALEQNEAVSLACESIGRLEVVTMEASALVDKNVESVERMKGQANDLIQAVSFFKLSGEADDETGRSNGQGGQ